MWRIAVDLLLVSLGMGMGVSLVCLLQAGKEADKEIEEMKWRNEE